MNNRPIKFRIWDRELGVFENYADSKTGYLEEILIHPKGILVVKNTIALTVLNENRYVAQQYTGLKDSTGKEIYEGDIIEVTYKDGAKSEKMEVIWSNTDALWWAADIPNKNNYGQELYMYPDSTIIGNILETPELLA